LNYDDDFRDDLWDARPLVLAPLAVPVAVFGAFLELPLHVVLRPLVVKDLVDVAPAARVRPPPEHGKLRTAHDAVGVDPRFSPVLTQQ